MRLVVILFTLLLSVPLTAADVYVRAGLGLEETGSTRVRDIDCTSTQPPALFGCVAGSDGRRLGAYGDFGRSTVPELAVGLGAGSRFRIEAAWARRDLDLDANADFIGVAGAQPVRASGRSRSALLIGAIDLGPEDLRVRPFFAAGMGVVENETSEVTYAFPSIAPEAVTVIQGGKHRSTAWTVAAGAAFRLSASAELELALRMSDLGEMRTDAGVATIVRPQRTFELEIAGTTAPVQSVGAMLSLRWYPGRR